MPENAMETTKRDLDEKERFEYIIYRHFCKVFPKLYDPAQESHQDRVANWVISDSARTFGAELSRLKRIEEKLTEAKSAHHFEMETQKSNHQDALRNLEKDIKVMSEKELANAKLKYDQDMAATMQWNQNEHEKALQHAIFKKDGEMQRAMWQKDEEIFANERKYDSCLSKESGDRC